MADPLVCLTLGMSREGFDREYAAVAQGQRNTPSARQLSNYLDRPGLEARLCECYVSIKKDMARLMLDIPDADPGRSGQVLANLSLIGIFHMCELT
jgi:hypothetical protein